MNDTKVPIEPITKITTTTIVNYSFEITQLIPSTSATFRVYLYDSNNMIVTIQTYLMFGEDYEQWGSDDEYLIQWIKNKITDTKF